MFNYENCKSATLLRQRMDTLSLPKAERFETWRSMIRSIFPSLHIKNTATDTDFLASASTCKLDQHTLAIFDTAEAIYHSQEVSTKTKSFWLCLYFPISIYGETTHIINHKSINIPYSAGAFFIFDERHDFIVSTSSGKAIIWQVIIDDQDDQNIRAWQRLNPELAAALIRQHSLFPLLQQHLFELQRIALDADEAAISILFQYALQLLEEILQNILHSISHDHNPGNNTTHYSGIYYAAEQYIRDQMERPLKPEDLSDALGISRTTLFRAFTASNTTPQQHIVRLKLEKLHQLLGNKSLYNQQISTLVYQCGFDNIDQAGKLFKKHYGKTMSHYRKHIQHLNNSSNE